METLTSAPLYGDGNPAVFTYVFTLRVSRDPFTFSLENNMTGCNATTYIVMRLAD